MEPITHNTGAAVEQRQMSAVARLWSRAVDSLAALGTVMIVLLMVMICCDVVARNVLGGSLPLVSELGALTLVMIVYLQLGTAVRNERLARTDFFLQELANRSPRAAAIMSGIWDVFGVLVGVGIAYSTLGILIRDIEHREFIGVTGIMTIPTWPFRALILLGAAVATAQFTVQAFASFQRAAASSDQDQ